MNEYYFLFGLAFLWTIFASVQDFRKREVANWLNFSLVAFALAYRAFYSAFLGDWKFFGFGMLGFGVFFALANGFYYGRIFAGGDAKLMMALGAIIPFESYIGLFVGSVLFVIGLLSFGAVYGLIYSIFLVSKQREKFLKLFKENFMRSRGALILAFVFIFFLLFFLDGLFSGFFGGGFIVFIFLLFIYTRVLDECMVKKISPKELREGDWLEKDVLIGKNLIRKNVHGLSRDDIAVLRKYGRKVLIKEGIPFTIVFFLNFLFMVCVYLYLGAFEMVFPSSFLF